MPILSHFDKKYNAALKAIIGRAAKLCLGIRGNPSTDLVLKAIGYDFEHTLCRRIDEVMAFVVLQLINTFITYDFYEL